VKADPGLPCLPAGRAGGRQAGKRYRRRPLPAGKQGTQEDEANYGNRSRDRNRDQDRDRNRNRTFKTNCYSIPILIPIPIPIAMIL